MPPVDPGPSSYDRHSRHHRGRSRSPDRPLIRNLNDDGRHERRHHRSPPLSRDRTSGHRYEHENRKHSSQHDRSPRSEGTRHRSPVNRRRSSPSRGRRSTRSPSLSSSSSREHGRERRTSKSKHKSSHHRTHEIPSSESDDSQEREETRAERKERKRKKRERKKEKKEKKRLKKEKSSSKQQYKGVINEYGKFGIISEADMYTKDQEFRAWMVEEKMLNPETVPQNKMKELFRVYMEDYNTATLPHEKYYALEKYEARMDAIRSGQTAVDVEGYDPRADEAALAAQHKRTTKTDGEVYIGRAQLEQLRRIERERVEASRMKRMGMEVKESMGVRYEVD